ncbi:NAD(P)H-dependent flavin oxidoreductase [Actinomadura welshii]|uniref:NAD(P)H-dependent flavin oxidoreductase n=1 Tax=Actinomadura welshii TaxID=3103817 RepID=UPI0003AD3048|nr:nitronate monooxygenase [Actinomadura madurae]
MAALPLLNHLRVPVFCAPMFLVSDPDLVVAACTAGVVGTFNHLNARTAGDFERWMDEITARLDEARRADPRRTVAPFAVNVAVRRAPLEERYDHDMEVIREHEVPLVISMNGSPRRIAETVHGYGGVLIHDVPSVELARKAVDAGADGLIALCGGAGGHTGTASPFALVPQIRRFFDGPLALAGAVSDGRGIRAAQALGADYAYMGTRFIATQECGVPTAYKELLVSQGTEDVIATDAITGLQANFLRGSIVGAGLDPAALPVPKGLFQPAIPEDVKGWRDVWSGGHGVGLIDDIPSVAELVDRLRREYLATS